MILGKVWIRVHSLIWIGSTGPKSFWAEAFLIPALNFANSALRYAN